MLNIYISKFKYAYKYMNICTKYIKDKKYKDSLKMKGSIHDPSIDTVATLTVEFIAYRLTVYLEKITSRTSSTLSPYISSP